MVVVATIRLLFGTVFVFYAVHTDVILATTVVTICIAFARTNSGSLAFSPTVVGCADLLALFAGTL